MTYALSLILWMATAQTAGEPAAAPAAVVVQCPPSDAEVPYSGALAFTVRDFL